MSVASQHPEAFIIPFSTPADMPPGGVLHFFFDKHRS